MPASNIKASLAGILKDEGYIGNWEKIEDRKQGILRIDIRYGPEGEPVITGIERVSRPGCRRYVGSKDIPKVLGGLGINIVSTSTGLMAGHTARAKGVGGELIANIW